MTTIEITLPDALAAEAKAAGLLSAEAMENLVRSKLAAVREDLLVLGDYRQIPIVTARDALSRLEQARL